MPKALHPHVDADGLREYSVVYTDRALNHMSGAFQTVMRDISANLKQVYQAHSLALVPGSGSFGMEAVARQFANDANCLVIRNGWFSYRWTQILEAGRIARHCSVLKAARTADDPRAPFAPVAIEKAVETIRQEKPSVVFAPHVETSAGMLLPEQYLKQISAAVHEYGGLFVLDCIASGTIWVDMQQCGVDVLISAPQKGWSGPPCCGIVMLSEHAESVMAETTSSSFACDLKKWHEIMRAYELGGHAYHAPMPTESLRQFRTAIAETAELGFDLARERQWQLGERVRALLERAGFRSVAADGFQAPGVVVSYTDEAEIRNGARFAAAGLQIAAGVPLMVDEGADFSTFRIGLFGLDKLQAVEQTASVFEQALAQVCNTVAEPA